MNRSKNATRISNSAKTSQNILFDTENLQNVIKIATKRKINDGENKEMDPKNSREGEKCKA